MATTNERLAALEREAKTRGWVLTSVPPPAPATVVPADIKPKVVVSGTGAVVTWPASPAAEAVDEYQIYLDGADVNLQIKALTYTLANVAPGAHNVAVSAHNAAGYGPAANMTWVPFTIAGAPPAPTPPAPPPPGNLIPTQGSMTARDPLSASRATAQLIGTYPSLSGMQEPGINGSGNVRGSPLRFGRVDHPIGRKMFRHAMRNGDPQTAGNVTRVDTQPPNNHLIQGQVYWLAWDMLIPAYTAEANDDHTLVNIHPGDSGAGGTWHVGWNRGKLVYIRVPADGGNNTVVNIPLADAPAEMLLKCVAKTKLSSGGDGFCQLHINGKQVVNDTGSNTRPGTGDYVKCAFYMVSAWGDRQECEMFYGQFHIVRDAGYSLAQVTALLQ